MKTRSVLVTGCSSGIGAATARLLRGRGWRVVATARKDEDLVRLREEGFPAVHLDVADAESVAQAAEETLDLLEGKLGGLVNNAGYGQPGALEDLSRETMRHQFEVNLFGMQDLTNRFIPLFREQGWGRIVNISSVVGRVATPFYGAYSATKFAMEALSDALRIELRGAGVAVSLVEPGPIVTAFGDNSVRHLDALLGMTDSPHAETYRDMAKRHEETTWPADPFSRPPEAVAKKVRRALESTRPHARYCVTLPAYAGAFLGRFAPASLIDAVMAMRWDRKTGPMRSPRPSREETHHERNQ